MLIVKIDSMRYDIMLFKPNCNELEYESRK
jgi:hypothetical protein